MSVHQAQTRHKVFVVRTLLSITAAGVLLAATAVALAAEGEATKDALTRDPKVTGSQQPEPTAQGTRSPDTLPTDEDQVFNLVQEVRRNPIDVSGNPVPPWPTQPDTGPEDPPSVSPGALTPGTMPAKP